jgi:2-dehydro-3-deoxyglucarate aldolase
MDILTNPLRQLLKGDRVPFGTWVMSGATSTAEALGSLGFDWILVDMEHTPIDVRDAYHILQALAGTPAAPIVRIPWNDQVLVKRLMDAGAQSLMFPFVQSVEEARAAVSFTRYPLPGDPHAGRRGFAGFHRGNRYGTVPDYARRANEAAFVIVQIETPEAASKLEAIASVDGVDAIFLGPADLAANMGHVGNMEEKSVQAKVAEVAKRCRAIGKPCGIVGPTPEIVERYIGYGYDYVAIASDMGMMMAQARAFMAAVKPSLAKSSSAKSSPGKKTA